MIPIENDDLEIKLKSLFKLEKPKNDVKNVPETENIDVFGYDEAKKEISNLQKITKVNLKTLCNKYYEMSKELLELKKLEDFYIRTINTKKNIKIEIPTKNKSKKGDKSNIVDKKVNDPKMDKIELKNIQDDIKKLTEIINLLKYKLINSNLINSTQLNNQLMEILRPVVQPETEEHKKFAKLKEIEDLYNQCKQKNNYEDIRNKLGIDSKDVDIAASNKEKYKGDDTQNFIAAQIDLIDQKINDMKK